MYARFLNAPVYFGLSIRFKVDFETVDMKYRFVIKLKNITCTLSHYLLTICPLIYIHTYYIMVYLVKR